MIHYLANFNYAKYAKLAKKNWLLLVLIILFVKLLSYHIFLIFYEYPLNYREGAVLTTTHLLVQGQNPFSLENQPQYTQVYGIFFNLIAYPFARLWGSTLVLHRVISAFCILISCWITFSLIRLSKVSITIAFAGTLIVYGHWLMGSAFSSAHASPPDGMGLMLFLASIYFPLKGNFSFRSLFISIIFGILDLLTKPYFVLSLVAVCLYVLLFKSLKKAIVYAIASILGAILVLGIANVLFECYLYNCFFIHTANAKNNHQHMVKQLIDYAKYNFALIVLLFLLYISKGKVLLRSLTNQLNEGETLQSTESDSSQFSKTSHKNKFRIFHLNSLNLKLNLDLIEFCFIIFLLIFCLRLGQHTGNYLKYIFHLVSPFLVVIVCRFVYFNRNSYIYSFLILVSVVSVSFSPLQTLDSIPSEWKTLTNLVTPAQKVFGPPLITPLLLEQQKPVYDSGQTEYFYTVTQFKTPPSFILPMEKVISRHKQFADSIAKSTKEKDFDLIVLPGFYSGAGYMPLDLLKTYYDYKGAIPCTMLAPQNPWLNIWIPKP